MLNKILIIGVILLLNGCSVEDYFSAQKARTAFSDMCDRETLIICGDDIGKYNAENAKEMDDLVLYASYNLAHPYFMYKSDNLQYGKDFYAYMLKDQFAKRYGDCEDLVITLIEDNIKNGNLRQGEARYVFGEIDGETHAWAIISKEERTYIFDTFYPTDADVAFAEHYYRHIFTVYKY